MLRKTTNFLLQQLTVKTQALKIIVESVGDQGINYKSTLSNLIRGGLRIRRLLEISNNNSISSMLSQIFSLISLLSLQLM